MDISNYLINFLLCIRMFSQLTDLIFHFLLFFFDFQCFNSLNLISTLHFFPDWTLILLWTLFFLFCE